ncbi:hypothetical protein MRX96_009822 [Rhipicephalus microplus]
MVHAPPSVELPKTDGKRAIGAWLRGALGFNAAVSVMRRNDVSVGRLGYTAETTSKAPGCLQACVIRTVPTPHSAFRRRRHLLEPSRLRRDLAPRVHSLCVLRYSSFLIFFPVFPKQHEKIALVVLQSLLLGLLHNQSKTMSAANLSRRRSNSVMITDDTAQGPE